jgi:uncharacterized protein DUF3800
MPLATSKPREWLAMFSTVSAFFDESGKSGDHRIISVGCVAGYLERFDGDFAQDWGSLLHRYGVKTLSAKDVLNHRRPLSKKAPCLGVEARTEALQSFISCMRRNAQLIVGCSTDVKAFRELPPHFFQFFGNDPSYMTFVRTALHVTEFTPDGSKVTMICDDDEETALPFYKLYRRIKKVWPEAHKKFGAIAFVDDRYLFGVQASDLVASILRYQATEHIVGTSYEYRPLFDALTSAPKRHERFLFNVAHAIADHERMAATANALRSEYHRMVKQDAKEQGIREIRSSHAATSSRSAQRNRGQTKHGKSRKKAKS